MNMNRAGKQELSRGCYLNIRPSADEVEFYLLFFVRPSKVEVDFSKPSEVEAHRQKSIEVYWYKGIWVNKYL